MKLEKLDQRITNADPMPCSRVVLYRDLAFFTGHSAAQGKDIWEQTALLCRRYDTLLAQYGLKKEHILYAAAYLQDKNEIPDYEEVFKTWVGVETPPAGVAVQAPPMGGTNRLELELLVARETPDMTLLKLDQRITGGDPTAASRVVIHNGVAYFTGHSAFRGPGRETLAQQTRALLRRYDELLVQFGLKKERILSYHAYLRDIGDIAEFADELKIWLGGSDCPAGVAVQAPPGGENNLLELALTVAADDKPIDRYEMGGTFSRLVVHNGIGYFTGHVAKPTADTYAEQLRIILGRYDALFCRYGLKKEHLLTSRTYLDEIGRYGEIEPVWADWAGYETPPAGVAVEAPPEQKENLLELELQIAVEQ